MKTSTLTEAELSDLKAVCPLLPTDYLAYLRSVGWGEAKSGRMIYSGPISPQEVYGESIELPGIVLLGDDFAGYCFGYDLVGGTYGEVSPTGGWQPWPSDSGFRQYVGA